MINHVLHKPLRVAIDAPITNDGRWGGTEQFVMSLVHGLGRLEDGDEEYIILVHQQNPSWLDPYLGPRQQAIINPFTRLDLMKAWLGPLRKPLGRLFRQVHRALAGDVPVSNGFYESLGVDIIHFPHHSFVRCNLPTVYTIHDLQHIHYPQFFSAEEIAIRNSMIQDGCHKGLVVTGSEWTKKDLMCQYSIIPQKIFVIRHGAPTELYAPISDEQCAEVIRQFRLPQTFVLYPAQTWEHKNHIRLLEAVALLRDRERMIINLVCTGRKNSFWRQIEKTIHRLRLADQVYFLGFVKSYELRALYRLAQFVVFPSLFEGGGLPVLEAFHEKRALACSTATSLPEYADDAALMFDPTSVESIAQALARLSTDAKLRAELVERGTVRSRQFTWEHAARAYRALYRLAAGRSLSSEEVKLLQSQP